jgi:lipopolysaccharide biosynthesis regulator YciM
MLLAKLYQKEGREKKVLETWNSFFDNVPEKSHWIFNDLEQYLYDLNRYHELLGIYQNLARRNGAHKASAQMALARHYYKIGKKELAQETILAIQNSSPDKKSALKGLIRYYLEVDKNESTLSKIHMLLADFIKYKEFICNQCKAKSREAEWHCPECGAWDSYSP